MALSVSEKKAVIRELAAKYRKAHKKDKGRILDQAVELLGYNRSYVRRALRGSRKRSTTQMPQKTAIRGRGRKPVYGETIKPLRKVWAVMTFPCGKRLAPFMAELINALERHGELSISSEEREKLLKMSAATIDRLMASERRRLEIKGRCGTKPGSLLKGSIPIRTFAEWNNASPGFLEIDLVAHDGGNARGDFAQTLDMVDVATGWTETAAVPNKAQRWVFEAITASITKFPFPVLGIDSDNGSEFINHQLKRFCEGQKFTFTRSRPYRKNDNCHVEQKNWAVVRRMVGYLRFDTQEQVALLNELYQYLRLYTNFFQPSQKLIRKERTGSKVRKAYDKPLTPYQRISASPLVQEAGKAALTNLYESLNPAELRRQITRLQNRLLTLSSSSTQTLIINSEVAKDEYIFL